MRLTLVCILATAVLTASAEVRYVFYFIGDGMGMGHATATESYLRDVKGREAPLMMQMPVTGLQTTCSASSPVTDSAAAGTALATGVKTRNSMLGMTPDSTALTSIATRLKAEGYGVGLVTNVAPDDATPAAFYASVPHRKMYDRIGEQAARSGFDFLAGSNWRSPEASPALFAREGWTTVRSVEAPEARKAPKVVLLNVDSLRIDDVGYTLDSIVCITLPQMTRAGLDHLQRVSPDRFFMMVEGGNIDWAGHANDGATIIREMQRFDEALGVAHDFYLAHPDETLIVVTADHETGGLALGNNFLYYDADLALIDHQRMSKDAFTDRVEELLVSRPDMTWEEMKADLKYLVGLYGPIQPTEAEDRALRDAFDGTFGPHKGKEAYSYYRRYSPLAMTVYKVLNDHYGLGFTTMNHSGTMVPVYAEGVGAELFAGLHDNTEIPMLILRATAGTMNSEQ